MRYLVLFVVCLATSVAVAQGSCGGVWESEHDGGGDQYPNQTTFRQIQQWSGWFSGNNIGGGTSYGVCWMEPRQKQPSLSGDSTDIYNSWSSTNCSPSGCGPANALFVKKMAPPTNPTLFNDVAEVTFSYNFMVDTTAQTSADALEFDIFQFFNDSQDGWVDRYMMGTQCADINGNGTFYWELWNSTGGSKACGAWENNYQNNIPPCTSLIDGNWHHVTAVVTLDHTLSSPAYTFQGLYADYNPTNLLSTPIRYPALEENSNEQQGCSHDASQFGIQFQTDVMPNQQGFHEWFDNATVCIGSNCTTP